MFQDPQQNREQNTSSGSGQYEYVFSAGYQPEPPPAPRGNRSGGRRFALIVAVVLLCVSLMICASAAGALFASSFREEKEEDTTTAEAYIAPASDRLLREDPADVLDKSASSESVYGSAGEDVLSISQVVRQVRDAVVVIDITQTNYFGTTSTSASGSGVIISDTGYILTCNHVVANANSITVKLNSGSKYDAAIVGCDENSDLAVIRIEPNEGEKLVSVKQGCSGDLVVGEWVVAIGNPLGTLGGTVTNGIISATERTITTSDGTTMTLLQTNAAINSGNSGGGLFNLQGELIGVVNAKYAASGVEGLAFAIPIDSAYEVEEDLIQYGYVRGIVDSGLETLDITESNYRYYYAQYGIKTIGVYVISSEYCTDLQNADRILSVDGKEVKTTEELEKIIEEHKVGDKLSIRYYSQEDKTEKTTELTLREYVPDRVKNKLN